MKSHWLEQIILATLFILIGGLIIVVFSHLRPVLDRVGDNQGRIWDYLGRFLVVACLCTVTLMIYRSKSLQKYTDFFVGLLILAIVVTLDRIFSIYLMDHLGLDANTPKIWSLQKLNECIVVVSAIILLTKTTGGDLGSIYIQRGNLKQGLTIGIITFVLAAVSSPFLATFLFGAKDLTVAKVINWFPWLMIFVFCNAAIEELMFRGLFLRRLELFFGPFLSNLLIVLVFTALHKGVDYTTSQLIFLAALMPLGLLWGYLMQQTHSIWASLLFHAGMDIPVMLGIFSNQ